MPSPASMRSASASPMAPGWAAARPGTRSRSRCAGANRAPREESDRMRLSLRQKLLLFAVAIAILPLIVAGRTMIRIAQDELKSSANEELGVTSEQLVEEINDLYERTW